MRHTWSRVDYDLIDRLEQEQDRRERAYVCPMWDWLKDFREKFASEGGWWETTIAAEMARIEMDPTCGLVIMGPEFVWVTCDQASGEITNDTDLCDDCGRGDGHDPDCFYHGPY